MFVVPPLPANEAERLDFLLSCGILDTPQDERFGRLTRIASRVYEADVAFLSFVDDRYQWMKAITGDGIGSSIERERSVCQIMIASGEPLVFGDMQKEPKLDGHPVAPFLPFRFYAGVPLLTPAGAAVGSLCILKREPQDAEGFDLSTLIDLAAVSMDEVELWRLNQDLERAAQTDGLTSIANRRAFDQALERAIRRAHRTTEPLSLLLLDLDHFKALNDTAGHQAGDEVLRRFAGVLAQAARRPDDVAARYGGEEFALILPATDQMGALEVAQRLRENLAAAEIRHPRGIDGLVTVSIGAVTGDPAANISAEMLVSAADGRLYEAKRAGRNRVVGGSLP
ncbi:sensor domain-containing diguanylate cyclase [Microvirga sp. Mcv34]|uniref:sensor domain-containing diguanylate cyclase n=1 Tax=Microvirga sp. Mcv34 TaxID=2926016 RepID=UPI0021C604A2|nr:sensor domain-containing diguanylate cyclase [Microvirga sp. Mcv34]